MSSYALITERTSQAVTLAEAKRHLKETTTENDIYIQDLIIAAQDKIEDEYDLSLTAQTWEMYLDEFPDGDIEIHFWPIASITSVKYTDEDGNEQTVTSTYYSTDLTQKPARIKPDVDYDWPDTQEVVKAVQVRFVTGWTSPDTIPGDIKQAILLIISDWFDNREDKGRRFTRVSEMILNKYKYR